MDKAKLPTDRTPALTPEPLLLRPAEAARFLAISPRKLWELTNTREIPAIRIGRSDALVDEAERILRQHKIDQIAVVDEADTAVGLVDVQDLLDTRA